MADANIDAENEDSWLYGSENEMPTETSENQQESDLASSRIIANEKDSGPADSSLTTDHAINGSADQLDASKESLSTEAKDENSVVLDNNNEDADDRHGNDVVGDNNLDGNDSEEENDDSEDDVCVTIGDVRIQTAPPGKFQGPPIAGQAGAVGNHMMMAPSAKPSSKGVDLDAMGSVRGVNIYEFDLNSIKIDEKPWRKPGADITDYFNYGFTEDTWMKYCEKQRRMRVENNCRSGLIVGNGQVSGDMGAGDLDSTYLGVTRRQSGQRQPVQSGMGVPGKQTGVIDVIGGTLRDSRRPQQDYATDAATSQSPATSVSAVMPISMSVPPPMLNMPLPDFALPPPSALPPGAMGHPVIGPPHGLLGHPPIIVAPPPNFAPPPMPGHQFDPFFRPSMIGGPPPNAINHGDRRGGVPGFPDRPPYRMENIYGVPPPFQTNMPPPHWDARKLPGHPDERPPQWRREGSRSRESEISSSSTEETRGKSREKYEPVESKITKKPRKSPAFSSRGESRQRSRDKSSRRDYERDRGRDRERERERERERRRERDYDASRSRHHSRHHSSYRDDDRSSRHYSSSKRRERSPQDDYYSSSSSRHQSKKHRHDRSPSSSASSEKERKKSRSTSTEDHKK